MSSNQVTASNPAREETLSAAYWELTRRIEDLNRERLALLNERARIALEAFDFTAIQDRINQLEELIDTLQYPHEKIWASIILMNSILKIEYFNNQGNRDLLARLQELTIE